MKKILTPKIIFILSGVVLVLLVGAYFIFRPADNGATTFVVAPIDLNQTVSLVGTVAPVAQAELAFETSGRIVKIPAPAGTSVRRGDSLVELELDTLSAQLDAALADLALRRAETQSAEINLDQIRAEQDTLVENAYRALLTDDLIATPSNDNYSVTAPTITGRYEGKEGTYKINIVSNAGSSLYDFDLRTFDLEKTGPIAISKTEATPLGTKGLFISFPDSLADYKNTIWFVNIPNITSANYASNYNDYQEAKKTRERTLAEAEASLIRADGGIAVKEAAEKNAAAEVARIRAEIARRILRAPIDGLVTTQDARLGEMAASDIVLVRIIDESQFEVEVRVSEMDIAKMTVGNKGVATLDAYGDSRDFPVTLKRLDSGEVVVQGVPTYKAIFYFEQPNSAIKSGMTANIKLQTAAREKVLAVPAQSLIYENNQSKLKLKNGEIREVITGLAGDNGLIEIISGLRIGDEIIVS